MGALFARITAVCEQSNPFRSFQKVNDAAHVIEPIRDGCGGVRVPKICFQIDDRSGAAPILASLYKVSFINEHSAEKSFENVIWGAVDFAGDEESLTVVKTFRWVSQFPTVIASNDRCSCVRFLVDVERLDLC